MTTGPSARSCAACGRTLAADEVYYRFHLVLEADQDVVEVPEEGTVEALSALVHALEAAPEEQARDWEDQVHWERTGVVCTACRKAVVRLLAAPPEGVGPH